MPVMLLEGFERTSINRAAYNLLKAHETQDIALLASTWDPSTGQRPEATIPLPSSVDFPKQTDIFKTGQTVIIRCVPYSGQIGLLEAIHDGLRVLPNGLRVQVGSVRLDSGKSVIVPLSNLEVIA